MTLDEIQVLQVLTFDSQHTCLCGNRTVMETADYDGEEPELYVVCRNDQFHPLSDLCDPLGNLEDGIELAETQVPYIKDWSPDVVAMEKRVMTELQTIVNANQSKMHLQTYLDEALYNLILLRYCVDGHAREATIDRLLQTADKLAGVDEVH